MWKRSWCKSASQDSRYVRDPKGMMRGRYERFEPTWWGFISMAVGYAGNSAAGQWGVYTVRWEGPYG